MMGVGIALFFSFFFGVAWSMATTASVHDHDAFRREMESDARVAGTTFAMSAAGMGLLIAGAFVRAGARKKQLLGRVIGVIESAQSAEHADRSVTPCAHCGASLARGAASCRSCGAPA
jgi:hypothetical protein